MTHDLDDLIRAQAALEAVNLRLASVLSTAVDGIVTIDGQGIILTVNPATERLFGYQAEEMVGQNVRMLMPEPYRAAHDGYLARYHQTRERRIIGIGREVVGRRKDGSTFPMDLAVGEALLPEGRVFTGIIRDITERKRSESALRAAKKATESVVATLPVAVVSVTPTNRVQLWNQAAEAILGWSAEQAVGKPLPPTLFEDDDSRMLATRLCEGVTHRTEEVRCRRADGTVIDAALSSAPLRNEAGDLIATICAIDDITQRKSLATQLYQAQKMEAVGQLTGGLAHDFNNILGVAIGNLDLLAEDLDGQPDKKELAEAAQNALLKGADLTRQLLAFSRRHPLKPKRIQVEDLLTASIRMLRRTLGEQIDVAFQVDEPVWPVAVDVAQLEAAITNLAINARDAMTSGGRLSITLRNAGLDDDTVGLLSDVAPGDYVLIEISDTGGGMAPTVLSHVFEPFFTTKPVGKGTGLGLSMVYGFVKQSGGHIRIYSEVGYGTTVKLYLPRIAAQDEPAPPEIPTLRGGNERILVVEDNADLRRIVLRQLQSLGYQTMEAEDGVSALEILRSDAVIDLMFTDIVMPHGVSGFDLRLKAEDLRPGIRVLFTSGFPGASFGSGPDLPGGTPLLSKPYRKQDLALAIRTVLEPTEGR